MSPAKQKPTRSTRKRSKSVEEPAPKSTKTDLEEALEVKARAFEALGVCGHDDVPKFVDAYARASNAVRQLEKDRRKAIGSFTDDELVAYLRTLPDRRREAIHIAVQGASLAGKPLF